MSYGLRRTHTNDPRNIEIGKAGADRVFVDDQVIPGTVARTALFFGDSRESAGRSNCVLRVVARPFH